MSAEPPNGANASCPVKQTGDRTISISVGGATTDEVAASSMQVHHGRWSSRTAIGEVIYLMMTLERYPFPAHRVWVGKVVIAYSQAAEKSDRLK
ncbi:hypothetical protein NPIL_356071 [Nephila pilipes]|uniref:Uncharacterized protein n=1 Tax=Nephila pilipes TaxID=299642 RepID=A0A8X6UNT0_NEPPI|nr:hypothetical protein NPIL_356071 [Nephila pilipes]